MGSPRKQELSDIIAGNKLREEEERRERRKPFTQAVVSLWKKQGIIKEKMKQVQQVLDSHSKSNDDWNSKDWEEAFDQVVFEEPDLLLPLLVTNLCQMAFDPISSEAARIKASEMLMTHIKETAGPEPPSKITKSNILEISEKALHSIIIGKGLRN